MKKIFSQGLSNCEELLVPKITDCKFIMHIKNLFIKLIFISTTARVKKFFIQAWLISLTCKTKE